MPRVVVETGGSDWLTPVATLVGVLIGGLLTWLAQARLAERRAEIERKAAERLTEAEARAAARVLRSDLSAAAGRLDSILKREEWRSIHTLALISWGSAQASLAKRLNPDTWDKVAEAAIDLRALDDLQAAMPDPNSEPGASSVRVTPVIRERLESALQHTTEAYALLEDVARGELA